MTTHVKVLGVLFLALSALTLLAALFILLAIGGTAATVGMAADPDAARAIPIIGLAGTAIGIVLLLLSLPGIVTGWGLLNFKPWARVLGIVLSALNLLNIPFGTMLGAYGLWVLLNKDTEPLFKGPTISSTI